MSADHIAIVLAAGGSRRLGQPKQLLKLAGVSLLRRALALAAQTQPQRLLVVLGANVERMTDELAGLEVEIVRHPDWADGLASSLRAAAIVAGASTSPALLLGCDQPALTHQHLSNLLSLAATASSGCAAAVYSGRLGIPAVVSSALLAQAHDLRGDRGLGAALNALPPEAIGNLPAPELARDLDTVADCERAVRDGLLDAF